MPSRKDSVLVTGGAGYIGSHACKALSQAGFTPVAYDNLSRGNAWAVKWGPLEVGDIADQSRLVNVLDVHRPIAVMHFAAYAYVGESVTEPMLYYTNNVSGTLSLISAMRAAGIDRLVFSSTCATYGVPSTLPITEAHPQAPISPYGHSKLMIERILRDADAAYGLRSISLRYFNAAGADPDGEIGEAHDPEPHLIPLVLGAAAGSVPHLTIHGSDYPTHDGTCIRDYVHVSDLADAHVRALRYLIDGNRSDFINLGTGEGCSIRQVVTSAEAVTGRRIPLTFGPRRPGDPAVMVADAGRAEQVLQWRSCQSDMDTILQSAWAWMQSRLTADQ